MSPQPNGPGATAASLSRYSSVIWRHGRNATTVLGVKSQKRVTIEGAPPFYRGSQGGRDADFTHVVVEFEGLPFPCILGPDDRFCTYSDPVFPSSD